MASVSFTEHVAGSLAGMQTVRMPPLAKQVVTIPGTSSPFSGDSKIVRINVDAGCRIAWGPGVSSAGPTDARFIAGQTEYFEIHPGDSLAVIADP